ncbi:branched-chain amino acid transport system II carrier protein [Sutcliffiella horikoshii]|uniref:branched-chain amino acid transport system II carrier protein n=1 Tax=Sutcliffiella horikoshii TaxID=79883 RepID=UPI001CFED9D1|nr:branched-chain amino acid transport system II carrier protein [Sutcliffiella horikoshii]
MTNKMPFSFVLAIGFMLFALFFGAGNLIFPAMLGQSAGTNIWSANAGFIVTGVGLPLLGVLALGYSGKSDLQSLASRVHPVFGLVFTVILYLAIGPLFAIPRTGTASFEMGIRPFLSEESSSLGLLIFTILFFGITVFFSLKSTKIVDIVGKVLTPLLLIFIGILIATAFIFPIGSFQAPTENYVDGSFFKGFQEGYLTMDALAAFVFGIVVINAVKAKGATTKKEIMIAVTKAGSIAAGLLAIIYTSLSYIGASSVEALGLLENGGAVLSGASNHFFGAYGGLLLSLIVIGACLTTSIGLIISCSSYFNKLLPNVSYKTFVIVLSTISAIFANVGLTQLIAVSVPVLVAIYPFVVCLMALTFLHSFFNGRKEVYQGSMIFTSIVAFSDALKAAGMSIVTVEDLFATILPLYEVGLGWIFPAIIGGLLGFIWGKVKKEHPQRVQLEREAS